VILKVVVVLVKLLLCTTHAGVPGSGKHGGIVVNWDTVDMMH
jgi:hypothetical protein